MKQPGFSWNRGWRNWQLCLTHSSQTTRTVRRCSRRLILSAKCKSCWWKESLIICFSRFFWLPRDSDKLVLPSLKTKIYTIFIIIIVQAEQQHILGRKTDSSWILFLDSIHLKFLLGRVKLFLLGRVTTRGRMPARQGFSLQLRRKGSNQLQVSFIYRVFFTGTPLKVQTS